MFTTKKLNLNIILLPDLKGEKERKESQSSEAMFINRIIGGEKRG